MPFFSSLSSVVGSELQEDLIRWLEEQDYWRRNSGRDHVFVVQSRNVMGRVRDRVKNSVLLETGVEQLTKDARLRDSWWNSESSEEYLGKSEKRKTLLSFMADPYGKEVNTGLLEFFYIFYLFIYVLRSRLDNLLHDTRPYNLKMTRNKKVRVTYFIFRLKFKLTGITRIKNV